MGDTGDDGKEGEQVSDILNLLFTFGPRSCLVLYVSVVSK